MCDILRHTPPAYQTLATVDDQRPLDVIELVPANYGLKFSTTMVGVRNDVRLNAKPKVNHGVLLFNDVHCIASLIARILSVNH